MSPQEIQQTVDELEKLGILVRTGEMRPDGTGKMRSVYALAPEYQCEEFIKALAEDRKVRLRSELARLDKEIREMRQEVECLQERLDGLEVERSDLLDELDDEED
jgi:flagellar motility protein MotE (MotC chaperone)